MAVLVVQAGLTPTEYRALTVLEREAIIRAINKRNRRRGR